MTQAPRPASCWALFLAFNRLALQGFGGVLAVAQRELVERLGWLERDEFLELFAVAQVMPGPNVVNLALMIGDRFFGLRGAFSALAGMLLLPSFIVLGLAASYGQLSRHPAAVAALRGVGAVASGLILATAIKLLPSLKSNPMGRPLALLLALLTLLAIVLLHLPLVLLVLGIGGIGMAAAWRSLARSEGQ